MRVAISLALTLAIDAIYAPNTHTLPSLFCLKPLPLTG